MSEKGKILTAITVFLTLMKNNLIISNILIITLMIIVAICIWTCFVFLELIEKYNSNNPTNTIDTNVPWMFIGLNVIILVVLIIVLMYTNLSATGADA
jgi:hypothetical protein